MSASAPPAVVAEAERIARLTGVDMPHLRITDSPGSSVGPGLRGLTLNLARADMVEGKARLSGTLAHEMQHIRLGHTDLRRHTPFVIRYVIGCAASIAILLLLQRAARLADRSVGSPHGAEWSDLPIALMSLTIFAASFTAAVVWAKHGSRMELARSRSRELMADLGGADVVGAETMVDALQSQAAAAVMRERSLDRAFVRRRPRTSVRG